MDPLTLLIIQFLLLTVVIVSYAILIGIVVWLLAVALCVIGYLIIATYNGIVWMYNRQTKSTEE